MAKKIAVIGDVMLDKYDYCTEKYNPESSAPCWVVEKTEYKPGGAGNTAANLKSLGSEVILIGLVGNDYYAEILKAHLGDLEAVLIQDNNRPTIVKERTIAVRDGVQRVRKDYEKIEYLCQNHVQEIIEKTKNADLILVSDYKKGMISSNLMEKLKEMQIPIIVDPKPEHAIFYNGVFLVKPNSKEACAMTGLTDDVLAGEELMKKLNANILLTRSSNGISYFGLNGERYNFPAEQKKVIDVTGAGDTSIAAFAHYLAKGRTVEECVRLANKAGGIAIQYPGCYQITEKDLEGN
jgi:D-beta-D-heptose 7-phosphate kinase/D-beta-D-heptose 1-phosphate adenosyltransferase